jgi:arylsulfatase A-like enzyme
MAMPTRPNFLCIITDQQRADHWGGGGNTVIRTPHLDRLAAEGVTFDQAFVSNPLCMPARATLFTGLTPRGHGVRTNGIPLDPRLPTITEALRGAGYRTHGIGKMHLTPFITPRGAPLEALDPAQFPEALSLWEQGRVRGLPRPYYGLTQVEFAGGHGQWMWGDYVRFLNGAHPEGRRLLQPEAGEPPRSGAEQAWRSAVPEELHSSTWIGDRALAFLQEQAGRPEPFFLWCSFPDPHHPYCPPRPWCDAYDPADVPPPTRREGELDDLPPHFRRIFEHPLLVSGRRAPARISDDQLREVTALTYGMVSLVDAQVGRILQALAQAGLRESTVVVFMSDHGDMMGDHWMLNKGPFHFDGLLRVPFIWSWPGRFAGGTRTRALASQVDFAPTILSLAGLPIPEGTVPPEPEAPDMPPPWPGRSLAPVLEGRAPGVRDHVVIENDEDYLGLRLRTLVTEAHQLTIYAGQPYGELFDRREDPNQLHNLWDSPAHQSLRRELEARLLHALVETDAALPRRLCHA